MANDVAKSGNTQVVVNAPQPSTRQLTGQFRADLSKRVDLATYEQALGALVDPGLLKKRLGWDNYVLCVMNAQREALKGAGKEGSLADIVGDPGNRTHFREVLKVLLATATKAGHATVSLQCLVPPNSASAKALEQVLNGGSALIAKQEGLKKAPPKFTVEGVGAEGFTTTGHDPALLAAAQARVAALPPPATK